jgi:hypothetical protein
VVEHPKSVILQLVIDLTGLIRHFSFLDKCTWESRNGTVAWRRQNIQFGQSFSLRVTRGVSLGGAVRGRTTAGLGAAIAVQTSEHSAQR